MSIVTDIAQLEALYGAPGAASLRKVAKRMTPEYREWIMASRFCVISTVGPEGTDASPRGDAGPVVRALDETTLAMADWRGNNRIDTLRNIVRDPRASLMFLVKGSDTIIRVNAEAAVSVDPDLLGSFERNGKLPRTVILFRIEEIYMQCARAPMRAALWDGARDDGGLPTVGEILAALTDGKVGGPAYDREWPGRAKTSMW
ncbi:MAG: pyridoxamine 5'-phosphate oxidase family protein [Brevirhabdus sp.]